MSKTTPVGAPGYNLQVKEAELLRALVVPVADHSKSFRLKSYADWLLKEIDKLIAGNLVNAGIWLSPDDMTLNKVGRHKFTNDVLAEGADWLGLDLVQLGNYPNGIDDIADEEIEPVPEPVVEETPTDPQTIPIGDASDRQLLEAVLLALSNIQGRITNLESSVATNVQFLEQTVGDYAKDAAEALQHIDIELKRRRGGGHTHKAFIAKTGGKAK